MQFGRPMPARPEAPDQAAKLEALHKKLLSEMKSSQSAQLKTLREDMRKETKRIETRHAGAGASSAFLESGLHNAT